METLGALTASIRIPAPPSRETVEDQWLVEGGVQKGRKVESLENLGSVGAVRLLPDTVVGARHYTLQDPLDVPSALDINESIVPVARLLHMERAGVC